VTNLRVMNHDAVEVLAFMIPDQSLSTFQLYFPDPWHKSRHHKRRIVQPEFIENMRPKLAIGGVIARKGIMHLVLIGVLSLSLNLVAIVWVMVFGT